MKHLMALIALIALLSPAEARYRDSVYYPSSYVSGRLVCALNVNRELERNGVQGTGSNLAKSFLRWGYASRPEVGAVAVYNRRGGGHVALVYAIDNRGVWVLNPGKRGWSIQLERRRAISYRVAK